MCPGPRFRDAPGVLLLGEWVGAAPNRAERLSIDVEECKVVLF